MKKVAALFMGVLVIVLLVDAYVHPLYKNYGDAVSGLNSNGYTGYEKVALTDPHFSSDLTPTDVHE